MTSGHAEIEAPPQAESPGLAGLRVVLVDDDDDFRESLTLTMLDEGLSVRAFSSGTAALDHLRGGAQQDVILLDWRMPGMNGLEFLHEMRGTGIETPVIFLTGLTDEVYENAALAAGAVDFVAKARRWSILMRRIELVGQAAKGRLPDTPVAVQGAVRAGPLELRFDINRARWKGKTIDLTLTEFQIVAHLVSKIDEDVSYREIFELVRSENFVSGSGPNGYRVSVRTFIKRIRLKFRESDSSFDEIRNYARFGYRWISADDA